MNMKEHILAALKEMFDRWEELLAGMSDEQISAPLIPSHWSTKDVMVHMWAWQQRSSARLESALLNRQPDYPHWIPGLDVDSEDSIERINAWIYETHREESWSQVHQNWRDGFRRLLELGERIPERDLLDSDKYPWLRGHSVADTLLATYLHHEEHLEDLLAWLPEHGKR